MDPAVGGDPGGRTGPRGRPDGGRHRRVQRDSTLRRNASAGFGTPGYPGIFYLGAGPPQVSGSTIT